MSDNNHVLKQIMEIALKMGQNAADPEAVQHLALRIQELQTKQERMEKDLYPDCSAMSFLVIREYVQELRKRGVQNRGIIITAIVTSIANLIMLGMQFLSKLTP